MPRLIITLGEVLDRLSILEIKFRKIKDEHRRHILTEQLDELLGNLAHSNSALILELMSRRAEPESTGEYVGLRDRYVELSAINGSLWEIEDRIRALDGILFNRAYAFRTDDNYKISATLKDVSELNTTIGPEERQETLMEFLALARSVYNLNDERHRVKKEIDINYGGGTHEIKCYDE